MSVLGASAGELAFIYAFPFAVVFAVWLLVSLVVWAFAVSPLETDFKHDLLRKFEERRTLRSARKRLSYGYVARLLLGDNCVQAALLYRLARFFARHRLRPAAEALHAFSKLITHLDVSPWAEIGRGVYFYHGLGTVIGKGTRIGQRAKICQQVTTGGGPTIGDDVTLWSGAKVIGRVSIGDRAEIGANAVVLADVPADTLAVGVPARHVPRTTEA